MPLPFAASLCISFAKLCQSRHLPYTSLLRFAFAERGVATHFFFFALPRGSFRFPALPLPICAVHSLCRARRFTAFALRFGSVACVAMPLPVLAAPFRCRACRFDTQPLLRTSGRRAAPPLRCKSRRRLAPLLLLIHKPTHPAVPPLTDTA